jgi:hypothetical protein
MVRSMLDRDVAKRPTGRRDCDGLCTQVCPDPGSPSALPRPTIGTGVEMLGAAQAWRHA